jgi:hypothetical protein
MGNARPHPPPRKGPPPGKLARLFGDVQVGWIGERAGVPKDVERWGWSCGFSPPAHLGHITGTAWTLDEARAAFERVWLGYRARCREADFEAWRQQRALTAWKYAMWDAGCRMPTQTVDGWSKCFCGASIDTKSSFDHIICCHMEVA